jgi:hypothetical protein
MSHLCQLNAHAFFLSDVLDQSARTPGNNFQPSLLLMGEDKSLPISKDLARKCFTWLQGIKGQTV